MGDAQQEVFVGNGADELQANWQTSGSESAGNRDGRNACEVGRAIQAK